ncbi:MAG: M64 family metallopeptidase [Verrucomicrobiota bacterium]|nr:M64 family metallopeptidase [Verrucomicrobiota bacterium]
MLRARTFCLASRRQVVVSIHGLLLAAASLLGQTLTPIEVHGPRSNRINLLILSEGYTAVQLGQFLRDATNLIQTFFGAEPYQAYRRHFNAYAISVASAQSGSDHPTTGGPYRNTYFNSAYEFYDYVITIPPNGLDPNPANGMGKVEQLINTWLPETDIVVLLVNDIQPGGSSGLGGPAGRSNRKPMITALNPFPPYSDIVVHESGHFFAGLVDEYSSPYPGYVPVEAPNATRKTNRAEIPWRAWIEPDTPIPTPASWSWAGVIGLFEGAQYQSAGWYRPKWDCKMRTLGSPFCEVCREQIVLRIYEKVQLYDRVYPVNTNIVWSSFSPLSFELMLVQPVNWPLEVRWKTNGVAVAGVAGPRLEIAPTALGSGSHFVEAEIADPTPWVRSDPDNRLYARHQWRVNVNLPLFRIEFLHRLLGDSLRLRVVGPAGGCVWIEHSPNLRDWAGVATNMPWTGQGEFTLPTGPSNTAAAFYRAVWTP